MGTPTSLRFPLPKPKEYGAPSPRKGCFRPAFVSRSRQGAPAAGGPNLVELPHQGAELILRAPGLAFGVRRLWSFGVADFSSEKKKGLLRPWVFMMCWCRWGGGTEMRLVSMSDFRIKAWHRMARRRKYAAPETRNPKPERGLWLGKACSLTGPERTRGSGAHNESCWGKAGRFIWDNPVGAMIGVGAVPAKPHEPSWTPKLLWFSGTRQ